MLRVRKPACEERRKGEGVKTMKGAALDGRVSAEGVSEGGGSV